MFKPLRFLQVKVFFVTYYYVSLFKVDNVFVFPYFILVNQKFGRLVGIFLIQGFRYFGLTYLFLELKFKLVL